MPFKINFKKSRQQYNVASKSVFVLTVELLNSEVMECTLSSESTGRDCMDNVCQRLGLQQPDLFGLKYVSRRSYPKIRWVDLDRPLKKQLDKYSTEPSLYLGVIFYVTDVSLLEDEVTRYHYFLQLKMDVVEGRLRCNYEQAIVLASYSLQAEFGDHDPEKHTSEYLKDFPLLPKPMISQFEDKSGALTEAIVTQHASLSGIAQQLAEIYYIVGAQQLDGYGQECFLCKDSSGAEVLLGASLTGICVRRGNGQQPQGFKWNDITNLVNHKRYFGIECQHFEFRISSLQFVFDDPEAAKYVWKMCVLQHTFYKMHKSATESSELNITLSPSVAPLGLGPSLEPEYLRTGPGPGGLKQADIVSFQRQSQNIPAKVELQAGQGVEGESGAVHSYSVSGGPGRHRLGHRQQHRQHKQRPSTAGSNNYLHTNNLNITEPHLSHSRLSGARSTNDLDQLSATAPLGQPGPSLGRQGTTPAYRPAPDYETAVLSKYREGPQAQGRESAHSSQPQLHSPPQQQYLEVEQVKYYPPPPGFPLLHSTYSTPELTTEQVHPNLPLTTEQVPPSLPQPVYKPPPPYPGAGAALQPPFSSSTPDLASQTLGQAGQVGGSSPDLVSRKTLGPAAYSQRPAASQSPPPGPTPSNLMGSRNRIQAFSTEELNSVYAVSSGIEGESPGVHPGYVYDQIFRQGQVKQRPHTAGAHLVGVPGPPYPRHPPLPPGPLLDTGHLGLLGPGAEPESVGEPIYQNQGQLLAEQLQLQQQECEGEQGLGLGEEQEPIYQNLPAHQGLLREPEQDTGSDSDSLVLTETDHTVGGLDLAGGVSVDRSPMGPLTHSHSGPRVALTTSREELSEQLGQLSIVNSGSQQPRRKLEMRQYLEPAVDKDLASQDESLINTINSGNMISKLSANNLMDNVVSLSNNNQDNFNTARKKSTSSIGLFDELSSSNNSSQTNHSRSKGRKRWGLNMNVKSGSLKSTKSDKSDGGSKSGDESRGSSGRGMGAMMLANLHGLTRSRPDILTESFVNAFNAPTKIPKESIGSFLESKLEEGEVVREFERIPKKKANGCNVSIASLAENIPRNRFKDVVPYDENRVKITSDKENKYGYVNASHISATVGDSQRFYIAAQGPLPTTVHNFWAMVQECDVHLIVMLTEVSGAAKASACIPYWPQNDGSSLEIGDFTITKKFSSDSGSYTTTTLQLTHSVTKISRRVWHLQYSGWQDHGCPSDCSKYLQFMEELGGLRRLTVQEVAVGKNRNTPVLVHCSAGVGRTGVTILSDILLYCADHNIDIDIPKVLSHLRQQRMLMVQTVAQYKFVHTVLINYLGQSRLI